ncbi:MAG: hypothetical protein KAT70_05190 [Thermoplasmata archaeon]|nr:hypothetical protein [Thermoplasmata archaeon]
MPTIANLVSEVFAHRLMEGVDAIISSKAHIRVFSHHDADGISAASVLCKALDRAGIGYHATILKGLERRFAEELPPNDTYIFMDMGSSHLSELEEKHMVVVLDHHKPARDSEKVFHVNTHILGVDGTNEACAASLAFLFSLCLDYENWDLAPLAMVGMIGDKQHLGGFKGVNKLIVEAAVKKGLVERPWGLAADGDTLVEAVSGSFDPYFPGLSGSTERSTSFLEKNSFVPDASLHGLEEGEMRRLASLLAIGLVERGADPVGIENIAGPKYVEKSTGRRLDTLVDHANASGKDKIGGVGVAMLMGASWALDDVSKAYGSYRSSLLERLNDMEEKGAQEIGPIQYIVSDKASLNGALAGIGMQFILPQGKATFVLSRVDGKTNISSRGTRSLVDNGLDLSKVCNSTGKRCGGEGGGHPIASGASVETEKEEEFLRLASEMVASQLSE